jgi:amidase
MTEPCDLSAVEARRLIGRRSLSPTALLQSCARRIEATNRFVNAIVTIDLDTAHKRAAAIEKALMRGEEIGVLAGLPIGVKDLQATAGLKTTSGSLLFKDHVPERDELSVANVRNAGGLILAKTNTPEFGTGGNTVNRVYGPTRNPFDVAKTCGGSSGGSAVALALGQVPLATGTDYGGSIRTPAAFCGVVGFRPSPGVVPRDSADPGLFRVTGPMARTVADAYLLLRAQLGDENSCGHRRIPAELRGADLSKLRVAVSTDLGCAPVEHNIAGVFTRRVALFRHVFSEVQERAPDFRNVHEVFEILRGIDYVAAHGERLQRSRALLDRHVIDNTQRGLQFSQDDLNRAQAEQIAFCERFHAFFKEVDVLICPAASVSPFPLSQLCVEEINGKRMSTYMSWLALVYAPTMALACAATLPCGVDHMGLPFGIQVIGPNGSDARVLQIAHALEQVLSQHEATSRPLPDMSKLATLPSNGLPLGTEASHNAVSKAGGLPREVSLLTDDQQVCSRPR